MYYLMCNQKVVDYTIWKRVLNADAKAQREHGLHLLHLLRAVTDPNVVVVLMRADDLDKARAFTEVPSASEAAEHASLIGEPEVSFLND